MAVGYSVVSQPDPAPVRQTYLGIQYLRAVAALMVVVFHVGRDRLAFAGLNFAATGASGVDLFFVISGFIMAETSGGISASAFLTRRFIRIVPLYWLFTTVLFVCAVLAPSLISTARASIPEYLLSLGFAPFYNPAHNGLFPLLVQGWTLNYEMAFYLVFAACLFLPPLKRLVMIGALFLTLAALGSFIAAPDTPFAFYTNQIILEFVMGMLLSWSVKLKPQLPTSWAMAFIAIGAFALLCAPTLESRFLARGVPATLIVWGVLSVERNGDLPKITGLAFLGDASYSIYLSHLLTLAVVKVVWKALHLGEPAMAVPFAIACATLSIGVGAFVFSYVELPMTQRLRAYVANLRAKTATTVTG